MTQREQLNLRLPEESFKILDAAAAVDELTLTEYVKALLAERVSAVQHDPDVRTLLKIRAERAGIKDGKVARISDRAKGQGSS